VNVLGGLGVLVGEIESNLCSDRRCQTCYPSEARKREIELMRLASERAQELLLSFLDETQRRMLRVTGYFDVRGPSGLLYRITRMQGGNIVVFRGKDDDLGGVDGLCAYPRDVPVDDIVLTQLFLLRDPAGEEHLWRVATGSDLAFRYARA